MLFRCQGPGHEGSVRGRVPCPDEESTGAARTNNRGDPPIVKDSGMSADTGALETPVVSLDR